MKELDFEPVTDEAEEAANIHAAPEIDLGPGFLSNNQGFDAIQLQNQPQPLQIEPMTDAQMQQDMLAQRAPQSLPQVPQPQAPVLTPQQPVVPQVSSMSSPIQDYAQAFASKEAGVNLAAQAQSQAAKEQAMAYEQQAKDLAALESNRIQQRAVLDTERKALIDAVTNGQVDPSRFYNNMSTGNKILAAISVALSGLASGLSGKAGEPNQALAIIQKSIDRDIEEQRQALGRKETLLSENLRRYGDLNTATEATRLQLNAVTQAKVMQSAAKANSALAKAEALKLNGDLEMQGAGLKEKLAEKQALASLSMGGGISDAQMQQLPKEVRERAVKIGGKYALAIDENSAKEAREIVGAHEAMMTNLAELVALRKQYGQETLPSGIKNRMQTIAENLRVNYIKANKLGTLDKGVERVLDKVVSDPTSIGFVLQQYDELKNTQERSVQARLNSLGIQYGGRGAQQPQYKTVNGIKYMRGPNGEAIQVQ